MFIMAITNDNYYPEQEVNSLSFVLHYSNYGNVFLFRTSGIFTIVFKHLSCMTRVMRKEKE